MHTKIKYSPDYIFESSWEVCNKVGGIYTVLSSRANTLQKDHNDSDHCREQEYQRGGKT